MQVNPIDYDEMFQARKKLPALEDALEMAWAIIANANGGDWDLASDEWREAAKKWRDEYHALTLDNSR